MAAVTKEYKIGDLVENFAYLRKPKLKGIVIAPLGFDKDLDDFIYKIYCYNTSKYEIWTHHSIKKI